MQSLLCIDAFSELDTIVQMAHCSFDIHVQEILGGLIIGATVVMLHPEGNIDFVYLSTVLQQKEISYMHTVPSLLFSFSIFLQTTNRKHTMACIRKVCSIGNDSTTEIVFV